MMGCLVCIECQKLLMLSCKVDECKPLRSALDVEADAERLQIGGVCGPHGGVIPLPFPARRVIENKLPNQDRSMT
jgi:hypothetical protein